MEGRSEQYERKLGEKKEDGENGGKEKEKTTQGRRARREDIEHCDEIQALRIANTIHVCNKLSNKICTIKLPIPL